jgi:hypothetical protein
MQDPYPRLFRKGFKNPHPIAQTDIFEAHLVILTNKTCLKLSK